MLTLGAGRLLAKEIAVLTQARAESFVTYLRVRDDFVRRHLLALLFAQRVGISGAAIQGEPEESGGSRNAHGCKEAPPIQ